MTSSTLPVTGPAHYHFAARLGDGDIAVTPMLTAAELAAELKHAGLRVPALLAVTRGEALSAVEVAGDGTWAGVSGCVGPCEPLAAALVQRGEYERSRFIAGNGETGASS
jgi:hypothetical protein